MEFTRLRARNEGLMFNVKRKRMVPRVNAPILGSSGMRFLMFTIQQIT
ncbi:hypothetical protein [Streptococcus plurextorum]